MQRVQTELKKKLTRIDGVSSASVNFAVENVTVEYNSSEVTPVDLKEAVKKDWLYVKRTRLK